MLFRSVLERAGLRESQGIVLALNTDDATLFGTVICRDAAADVPVIARVNHARNIENIYRAGADYVLSISDVSGEMLSARLLGRVVRSREEHRQVARLRIARSGGKALRELPIRQNGCSAIAIARNGQWITRLTGDTVLQPADELYVCGIAEAVRTMEL